MDYNSKHFSIDLQLQFSNGTNNYRKDKQRTG